MLATLTATFVAIYFVPLILLSLVNVLIIPRSDHTSIARILTLGWVLASAYALFNYAMAYAFHHSPAEPNPLVVMGVWIAAGMGIIWFPVVLRLKRK